MIPATQEQIEAACMTRGYRPAILHLREQGLWASEPACRAVIAKLIAEGKRSAHPSGGAGLPNAEVVPFDARVSCERMLVAMARAFQRKSERLGISFEQAMATSLGNVAVRA